MPGLLQASKKLYMLIYKSLYDAPNNPSVKKQRFCWYKYQNVLEVTKRAMVQERKAFCWWWV